MLVPTFTAYFKMVQLPDEVKKRYNIKVGACVPRFDVTAAAGYYKPLAEMANNKGQIVLYLNETRGIINSPDHRRADRYLQGKQSFNVSSVYLLDYKDGNGNLVGYGNANGAATFGKSKQPNPFKDYGKDGFLFLVSHDWQTIEMLVVPKGLNTILGNAKALADGVYNEALQTMRAAAQTVYPY